MVASFRASIGTDTDDPRVAQLVGELSLASEPFGKLWARHDVKARIEEFNALAGHEHVHKGMTSRDLTENVNSMARNLTSQVRGIARVVTAVAGSLSADELLAVARGLG